MWYDPTNYLVSYTFVFYAAPGLITFSETSHKTLQSKGKIPLKITRSQCSDGKVIVPWKVVPESPDSVYIGLVGE